MESVRRQPQEKHQTLKCQYLRMEPSGTVIFMPGTQIFFSMNVKALAMPSMWILLDEREIICHAECADLLLDEREIVSYAEYSVFLWINVRLSLKK